MSISRDQILKYFCDTYRADYEGLGETGIGSLLNPTVASDLAVTLREGGVLVFPHIKIQDCGGQVASVVRACLESGADQVLAIGVLHSYNAEMNLAIQRIYKQETRPEDEPLRGVYGPGLENERATWEHDHSLLIFRSLLADAARILGYPTPQLIERYPFLTGMNPESLEGIDELRSLARDSVVVSTGDHAHHGIGYGDSPEESLQIDETGLAIMKLRIEKGLRTLDSGDYRAYIEHCRLVRSDWRDAGPLVHHLRGPLQSQIIDFVASDFSDSIYASPPPTWCAGALIAAEAAYTSRL